MAEIKITGVGPILDFNGDEESDMYQAFSEGKVKVEADGVDITAKLGKTIVGPCIAGESIDYEIEDICVEARTVRWETNIEIDVDDFDPSKLCLYFSCDDRNEENGEFSRCSFDGSEDLKASYFGNMVNYDGENFFGETDEDWTSVDYKSLADAEPDSASEPADASSNKVQVVVKGSGIAYSLYPSLEAMGISRDEAKEQGVKTLEYKGRLYAQDEENEIPIILLRSVSAVEVNGKDIYEDTANEHHSDSILPEDSLEAGKYAVAKGKEMDAIYAVFNIELEPGETFSPAKLQLVITDQEFPGEDYLKSPYQVIYDGRTVLVEGLTRPLTERAYPQFVLTVEAKVPEVTALDVVLTEIGPKKLLLAKRLCDVTGLDLAAVNNLLHSVPCTVLSGLSAEEAEFAKSQIEDAGAAVELRKA